MGKEQDVALLSTPQVWKRKKAGPWPPAPGNGPWGVEWGHLVQEGHCSSGLVQVCLLHLGIFQGAAPRCLCILNQKKMNTTQNNSNWRKCDSKHNLLNLSKTKCRVEINSASLNSQGGWPNTSGPCGRGGWVVFGNPSGCPQLACLPDLTLLRFLVGHCFLKKTG